jgi:transposase
MRKLKEILRLRFEAGLSYRQIAAATRVSVGVAAKYVAQAEHAGLTWPFPDNLDEAALARLLGQATDVPARWSRYAAPDGAAMHQELKKKGVTLQLLWEEYRARDPEHAYRYAQFCVHYRQYRESLARSLRQIHRAGEKLFVDYAGQTVPIVEGGTGEIHPAQIFVAVLGASNYTYAEATWSQKLPDWIGSHVRAFTFMEGVTALLIPDNLKSGVSRACRYEPDLNPTYADLAAHYGVAVIPARPYKPKDKAKVEVGVQIVERWILARLRHQTFFSLAALNGAIGELLQHLNDRPFKKLPGCRRSAFEEIDRPALKPLPATPYAYAEWKKARVNIDYHIEIAGHYYSVPHALVKRELDVRITQTTVECLHQGKRVASHPRSHRKGAHSTVTEHMPKAHQKHLEWSPGRFLNWALAIGPSTRNIVQWQLTHRPHPEMGYRACLGLLNLARRYGKPRLEAACLRALAIGSPTRKSVVSILEQNLDQQPLPTPTPATTLPAHANVRGPEYYQSNPPLPPEDTVVCSTTPHLTP